MLYCSFASYRQGRVNTIYMTDVYYLSISDVIEMSHAFSSQIQLKLMLTFFVAFLLRIQNILIFLQNNASSISFLENPDLTHLDLFVCMNDA